VADEDTIPDSHHFYNSSMLEASHRTQRNSGCDFVTAEQAGRDAVDFRMNIIRLILVCLLCISCSSQSGSSGRINAERDLARFFIPANAYQPLSGDWHVDTWSARKEYTFDTPFTEVEYGSWLWLQLHGHWRHCERCRGAMVFTRLLEGEEQIVEIQFDAADPAGRIRVRINFTATAT
jgi:hypothetical protein